jgi:hypothetical protein
MGFSTWRSIPGVIGDRHVIVMLIVVGRMAYVRDFLPGMTVMTLMTMIYGLILNEGMRLFFVDSLTPST